MGPVPTQKKDTGRLSKSKDARAIWHCQACDGLFVTVNGKAVSAVEFAFGEQEDV
jgi:Zn-finger protein